MKITFHFLLAAAVILGSLACSKSTSQQKDLAGTASDVVEVYYFHFERRCASCIALEKAAKETVESAYAGPIKDGKLVFRVYNLDQKETETIAQKYMVVMPTLLIVKGDKQNDLTDIGFRYASSDPEKFRNELKSAIDAYLKGT